MNYSTKRQGLMDRQQYRGDSGGSPAPQAMTMNPQGYSIGVGRRMESTGSALGRQAQAQRSQRDANMRAWAEQELKERDRAFYRDLAMGKQQDEFARNRAEFGLKSDLGYGALNLNRDQAVDESRRKWTVSGHEMGLAEQEQAFQQQLQDAAFRVGLMGKFSPESIDAWSGYGTEDGALGAMPGPQPPQPGGAMAGELPAPPVSRSALGRANAYGDEAEDLRQKWLDRGVSPESIDANLRRGQPDLTGPPGNARGLDFRGTPTLRNRPEPRAQEAQPQSALAQVGFAPAPGRAPLQDRYGRVSDLQWAPGVQERNALDLINVGGLTPEAAAGLYGLNPGALQQRPDVQAGRVTDLLRVGVDADSAGALAGLPEGALRMRPESMGGSRSGGLGSRGGKVADYPDYDSVYGDLLARSDYYIPEEGAMDRDGNRLPSALEQRFAQYVAYFQEQYGLTPEMAAPIAAQAAGLPPLSDKLYQDWQGSDAGWLRFRKDPGKRQAWEAQVKKEAGGDPQGAVKAMTPEQRPDDALLEKARAMVKSGNPQVRAAAERLLQKYGKPYESYDVSDAAMMVW